MIVSEDTFGFSALHFTEEDLFGAYHTNELHPREEVIVDLDVHQRGLGGASCGPDTLDKYKIHPGTYELNYRIRPFRPDEEDPAILARQKIATPRP